jgi:hypothetical protein
MAALEVCFICCEDFNNSKREKIKCINNECNFLMCKACCRSYLLQTTTEPHCMNCKIQWNDDFLIDNLNRNFWTKDLKNHQKKLLLDIEKSRLQENVVDAKCELELKKCDVIEHEINEKIIKLKLKLDSVSTKKNRLKYQRRFYRINDNGDLVFGGSDDLSDEELKNKQRSKFIMKCTLNDCPGFLSPKYKCSICENYTCKDCLEQVGAFENFENHTCKKENIESAQLIRKETKNCPNCGVSIFKIDGCDQMWCVQCQTTFSWKTGKIETGKVHNPHYYEYLRRNGKTIPRDPQDIVCGGYVRYNDFNRLFKKILFRLPEIKKFQYYYQSMDRLFNEFSHYTLGNYREKNQDNDFNKKFRVSYLLKEIDEDTFIKKCYNEQIKHKRNNLILQILETLNLVITDFTRDYYDIIFKFEKNVTKDEYNLNEFYDEANVQMSQLIDYMNYSQSEINKIKSLYKIKGITLTYPRIFIESDEKEPPKNQYGYYGW